MNFRSKFFKKVITFITKAKAAITAILSCMARFTHKKVAVK